MNSDIIEELREFLAVALPKLQLEGSGGYLLPSGVVQAKFISIWPLIENFELYENLVVLLGKALTTQCQVHQIDVVVGSSVTVMHLLEGVRASLSQVADVVYLGSHPLQLRNDAIRERIRGKRIAILTDVVSSGTLISETSHEIGYLRGIPAYMLSLFHADDGSASSRLKESDGRAEFFSLRRNEPSLHWAAYSHLAGEIDEIKFPATVCGQVKTDKWAPISGEKYAQIDVESVYPRPKSLIHDEAVKPQLELIDIRNLLVNHKELALGYFRNRGKTFSIYARLEKTVEHHMDLIKRHVHGWYDRVVHSRSKETRPLIVTTPSNENRRLVSMLRPFLQESDIDLQFTVFSRYDEFDGSFPFLLSENIEDVSDRPVMVILSTIHSSETVRSLTALLSVNACRDISVFVILNRMTPGAASFMSRILSLMDPKDRNDIAQESSTEASESDSDRRRKENSDPTTVGDDNLRRSLHHIAMPTARNDFEFHSLFRIWDLATSDLDRVERAVVGRFEAFNQLCNSAELRSAARNDLKYFVAVDLHDEIDDFVLPDPNQEGIDDQKDIIDICLGVESFIVNHDVLVLINLLESKFFSKRATFSIFRYLLSDFNRLATKTSRLCLTNAFSTMLSKAYAEIAASTPDLPYHQLRRSIEREKVLLTGSGLFAQLFLSDTESSSGGTVMIDNVRKSLIRIRESFSQAGAIDSSQLARLYDIDWCFSFVFAEAMLSVGSFHNERIEPVSTTAHDEAEESNEDFLAAIAQIHDQVSDIVRQGIRSENRPGWIDSFEQWVTRDAAVKKDGSKTLESSFISAFLLTNVVALQNAYQTPTELTTGDCLNAIRRLIMWPTPRHSHAGRAFTEMPENLRRAFALEGVNSSRRILKLSTTEKVHSSMFCVTDMHLAARKLRETHVAITRLIRESFRTDDWVDYFRKELEEDIEEFENILGKARARHEIVSVDLDRLFELAETISLKLWGTSNLKGLIPENASGFYRFVAEFECDLRAILGACKASLARNGISVEVDMKLPEESEVYTLCDRRIFTMAIDNFASNFRHSENNKGRITVSRTGGYNGNNKAFREDDDRFLIEFRSLGHGARNQFDEKSTSHFHRSRLEPFDVDVSMSHDGLEYVLEVRCPRISKRGYGR